MGNARGNSRRSGPLAGITVVDLTSMISGPLATSILGDQGADVIKVEVPGTGDLIRHIGASRGGLSAVFNTINRNKRSVVLNLREARGKELLSRLVERADVFVENFRPGVAERMGLGYEELHRLNDRLIYTSIRGFGERGPYADQRVYDIVIQALSGMAGAQADLDSGRPQLVRNVVCDKITAVHAAQAVSAALFARERGAGGQHVWLSMLDAAVAFLWPDVMQGDTYPGDGVTVPAPLHGILSAYEASDGFVTVLTISDVEFEGLCRAFDMPELAADERFSGVATRMEHSDELAAIIREHTRDRASDEICSALHAEGVPAAPINLPAQVHRDPQVVANELIVELDHPYCGRVRYPGPVTRFADTPASVARLAPLHGEHTDEVLGELGLSGAELDQLHAAGIVA